MIFSKKLAGFSGIGLLLLVLFLTFSGCSSEKETTTSESSSTTAAKVEKIEKVVFHMNHYMPAVHPLHINIFEPFAKEVFSRTEGRVEIVVHAGNALASPPDTYDAVVSGVAGMGFVLPAYTPGRFPMTQILEYPFMFTSAMQANLTAREMKKNDLILWFDKLSNSFSRQTFPIDSETVLRWGRLSAARGKQGKPLPVVMVLFFAWHIGRRLSLLRGNTRAFESSHPDYQSLAVIPEMKRLLEIILF